MEDFRIDTVQFKESSNETKKFKCSVCFLVGVESYIDDKDQIFCKKCAVGLSKIFPNSVETPENMLKPAVSVRDSVLKLNLVCSQAKLGCDWEGTVFDYRRHFLVCPLKSKSESTFFLPSTELSTTEDSFPSNKLATDLNSITAIAAVDSTKTATKLKKLLSSVNKVELAIESMIIDSNKALLSKKRKREEEVRLIFCSDKVVLQDKTVRVNSKFKGKYQIAVFDKPTEHFKMTFRVLSIAKFVAVGLVEWDLFEKNEGKFRPSVKNHGFHLVSSEGNKFSNNLVTTRIRPLDKGFIVEIVKKGQNLRIRSKFIKEHFKIDSDAYPCLVFGDVGDEVKVLNFESFI